jgi:hypothetical protein
MNHGDDRLADGLLDQEWHYAAQPVCSDRS